MRRILTLTTAILLVSISAHPAAYAVGNVLLPDDNTPSVTSSPQAKTNDTPAPTPQTDAQIPVMSDPITPAQSSKPAYTPIPAPAIQPTNLSSFKAPQPIMHKTANGITFTIPTTIFNVPEKPTYPDTNASYAHGIQIGLGSNGLTADDVKTITKKLGFTADRVSSLCSLNMNGFVMTSTTPRMFDSKNQPVVSIAYNGNLNSVFATLQALCTAVQLGPEQGFVKQMGNKYVVDLGIASCQAPQTAANAAPPTTVTIIRDGITPIAKCTFQ